MYRVVQFIKYRLPFLWLFIDWINDVLFGMRYGKRCRTIPVALQSCQAPYRIELLSGDQISGLVRFFEEQPSGAFEFFRPHEFEARSLERLSKHRSFLMFVALDGNRIVGYFFLRCFANGKAFRGKIVDYRYRNRGIAKQMGTVTTQVATVMGLRMFGTISRHNYASMHSSEAVNEIRVIRELPDDYLYIEYLSKH